jgi:hypothetical protein
MGFSRGKFYSSTIKPGVEVMDVPLEKGSYFIDPLRKSTALKPREKVMVLCIGIIQISKKYTWHPCLECIFDVNNENKYGGYRGKFVDI